MDLDQDGDVDVLGAAQHDDEITWWENKLGDGTTWIEHLIDDNFDSANSLATADLDGDGHTDVLATSSFTDDLAFWTNPATMASGFGGRSTAIS